VSIVQRVGDPRRDAHRLVDGKLSPPVQPLAEALSLDVRHHVEEESIGLAGIEQREDVGVLEGGGGPDLGQEALGAHGGGQLGLQDLHRDAPLVLQVPG
jgi:hypothetical protein